MKKIYLSLLPFFSLTIGQQGYCAEEQVPVTTPEMPSIQASSNFTSSQRAEIEKLLAGYLAKHPEAVTNALEAGMALKEKETTAKMEKAVATHKDKIFKDLTSPIGGNPKGTQSLVVFMDPYCGYCRKFHTELVALLSKNKDVKVIYKDIPIMGPDSIMAIKAMLAAKEQGKYDQLQKAVFSADKHLTKRQLIKLASSVGIDPKKLQVDMKAKTVQAQIDKTLDLAKELGINGTPTLIVGETRVLPGYAKADDLNKMLREVTSASAKDQKGSAQPAS